MSNVLSFIVQAKDQATATLSKIKGQFGELRGDWAKAMAGMKEGSYSGILSFAMKLGPAIAAAGAAIAGLGAAVKYLGEGLADAAKIETFTIRLSKLTGSMESAKEAMRALTQGKDAVDDLFGEDDVLAAAIALKRLSGGALGTAADIKVLAGAAFDTGQSVSTVAQDIGALTGMITEGMTGWERYAKGLAKAGVLSFETSKAMSDMKDAGASAGEIVAFMWASLEKDHSGSIEKARDSIDGLSKAADDSMGDMKRLLGETLGKPFAALWNGIKIGFAETVSFIFGGIKDLSQFLGSFLGALSGGSSIKEAYNIALDNYEQNKSTKDGSRGDLASDINARAGTSDEQKTADKKAADEHTELLKKRAEAQKKYDEEQRTRAEQIRSLQKEQNDLETSIVWEPDGSNKRIEAETRILDIKRDVKKLQKEIADEESKEAANVAQRAREQANAEKDAKKDRLTSESQYKYHAAYDKMTPEEKLAQTEKNIKRWEGIRENAPDEASKKKASDSLIDQLKEKDRLQKEIADKADDRKKKSESLMDRDRELRESAMTPEQRMAESRKRAAALEKQLAAEKDPDKQLEIKSKLMDEAERQMSIGKEKDGGRRSLSWGDVAEIGYGQKGKKDPAREQVEKLNNIEQLLKDIRGFGPGGMTK